MYRHARFSDRDELYAIWRQIFDDSEAFAKWFFTERFLPDYCAVWTEGNRIAAAAHALPVHMRVRNAILPAALIAGVATLPEYRGRGIMRAMLTEHMRRLRMLGIPLVVYRPVDFAIYRSLCHYAVADKSFLTLPSSAPPPQSVPDIKAEIIDAATSLDALYSAYVRATAQYSAGIARSYADFLLKYRDYAADGVRCATAYRDGKIVGYSLFSETSAGVESPEALALDRQVYNALISRVADTAGQRDITFALPPDVYSYDTIPPGASLSTVARTAAGVTDVTSLLRATDCRGYKIEVVDPVLPENTGVYDISGQPSNEPARLRLDPGRLAQLVFGYKTSAQLISEGYAEALDYTAAAELDALLPRHSCYSVDEY